MLGRKGLWTLRWTSIGVALASWAGLSGCSPDGTPAASSSTGQVNPATPAYQTTYYAAARFAEQATMGPTPELIEEIRRKGFETWIDDQSRLPASTARPGLTEDYAQSRAAQWYYSRAEVMRVLLSSPDQLRTRIAWSLSQVVVVAPVDFAATIHWMNLLQRGSLGSYRDLLRDATINPAMGHFLNNDQNRPRSPACPACQPNENYARELMQLFSLGVQQLGSDGRPVLDARGKVMETYTQRDVEELARVLTGWTFDPDPPQRAAFNWGNWGKPMVPSALETDRDSGEKAVLGRTFPAGQSARKDLSDVVDLLVSHPNAGPFLAIRLIQHLVKSDPSPEYVRRVAEVFRNNGKGQAGDLLAVVKAVLLDPEARRGDDPGRADTTDGKYREPLLHRTAAYRALGCTSIPMTGVERSVPVDPSSQRPFHAPSVFNFYSSSDRSSVGGLPAPEQTLVNGAELVRRLDEFRLIIDYPSLTPTSYRNAGCIRVDTLQAQFAAGEPAFVDALSRLFFRGAMPATLRREIQDQLPRVGQQVTHKDMLHVIGFVLAAPEFGVMQ